MRAHPERDYRGFFRPPTSSSPRQRVRLEENIITGVEQGGGEKGGSSAATAATGGVGFDLNQPSTEEVEEASDSEAAQRNQALQSSSSSVVRRTDHQEENKVGFDLNQLPPSEDDHDQHKP
ncbi:hypothetical protein K1719_016470 [Acacia pycnantha]|nr:hypothetical protein K1719_016470 [Acacia pycnantha]